MLKTPLPLHVKSDYSFGLAVGTPAELAERAALLGLAAMALTDRASLAGQVEFHEACRARGVTAITGVELAVADPLDARARLVALARDVDGYRALCRLTSKVRNERADPVTFLEATRHRNGLFLLTDSPRVARILVTYGVHRSEIALLLARPCVERAREEALWAEARALGIRVVADVDAVMPCDGDADLFRLSTRIRARLVKRSPGDSIEQSLEGVAERFADVPEAVENTHAVAEACELRLGALREAAGAHGAAHVEALQSRLAAWRPPSPAYAARLHHEVGVIAELGLADYVTLAADVAAEARRRGISVAVRGSAVSSLVVHALGLSPIDPVARGLYFERFMRASRKSLPDIDLDVASNRREELAAWIRGTMGTSRVAAVGAYQTFRRRSAYRAALAALGMPAPVVRRFAEAMPDDELELPVPVAMLREPYRSAAPLIERLVGRPRHLGTHPSALTAARRPLLDSTPLVPAPKRVLVTDLDGHALSELGVLKLDLLGSRALSELDEVATLIGEPLDANENDAATLDLLRRADTVACPQLETPLVRGVLRRMPIARDEDVIAALALVRPGPGTGSSKETFLRRARGEEPPRYLDPRLRECLSGTYGVLLYEENVIAVIARVAGCSVERADEMRAALVRGEDVSVEFVELATGNGFDEDAAQRIWADVARFAAYSFSKAHAASAALVAYRSAYAKAHHVAAFACAIVNHHGGSYPPRTVVADLARHGAVFRAPHVNASSMLSTVDEDGAVRIGFDKLAHAHEATKRQVLEERAQSGPFRTLSEFTRRVPMTDRELAAFVMSGACDGLEPLEAASYPFVHMKALGAPATGPRADATSGMVALYQALARTHHELRLLGMHVTDHPMRLLRGEARRSGSVTTADLDGSAGRRVRLAAIVAALRRVRTDDGDVMAFVTFEDELGLVEAKVTPAVYARLADPIRNPGPYLVDGTVELDHGMPVLRVDAVRPFHERERPYAA